MSISFSGVGSGLPINEWIEALVGVQQAKVDSLTAQQKAIQEQQKALDALKTDYNAIQNSTLKFTDSLLTANSDIFSKTVVSTSEGQNSDNLSNLCVKATVSNYATPSTFDIEVLSLATTTTRYSDSSDVFRDASSTLSELGVTKEGKFEINGAEITVKPDMTVDSLVYQINNSTEAGVEASLEKGKLVLKSKEGGNQEINISGSDQVGENGETFAALIGFDKNDSSHLVEGQPARFKIDGIEKTANSNTLTSEDTGILGLTLELQKVTPKDEQTGESKPVTIDISRGYDSEKPLEYMKEFIDAFNKAISDTDSATNSETGVLSGESSLSTIRNNLRRLVTAQVDNPGNYKSLADIGITTGAPGMSVDADTNQLVLDEEKFIEAFEKDPASVKALLVGDNRGGETSTGLMQDMQESLKAALDTTNGYFKARNDSFNSQLDSISKRITKQEEYIESYRSKLTKQFNYMDQQIAQMQSQLSQMSSQLKSLGIEVG